MPAIQPARLRMQVEALMELFHQPMLFANSTNELLGLYADYTQRPSQTEAARTLLPAYNTPMPVLKSILSAARLRVINEPESALACCDALWDHAFMESRLLAANFLGKVPPGPNTSNAIMNRIENWCAATKDDIFRIKVVEESFALLAIENPRLVFETIERNLESKKVHDTKIGLALLSGLAKNPGFNFIPTILNLAGKAIRTPNPKCKTQTLDLMIALVKRTPKESAFLFTQVIQAGTNPDAPWLVRQTLEAFPPELTSHLRELTRQVR